MENKSDRIFCVRQVYKFLPINLGACKPIFYFFLIHHIWGERVLRGAVFIIQTSYKMQLKLCRLFSIRQLSQKKQKLCAKSWITNGILKSIKTKHKLYKTHFLSNNPIKVTEYKKYANKLNWLKNICKKNYFSQHFNLCKNNLKASWKLIGMLVQGHPTRI